jgi:hypothetical protein
MHICSKRKIIYSAVKTHLWIAICIYLILEYIKYELKSNYSVYEIMQILDISALDKTPIRELLCEQHQLNQNVKE